jgi:hypothetical protein
MGQVHTTVQFHCPVCGKRFDWSDKLAGRKARCSCGHAFVIPTSADGDADTGYDLAPQTPMPVQPIRPPAAPLAYATPGRKTNNSKADPQTIVNLYAPIWLLGGGIVVLTLSQIIEERISVPMALVRVGIQGILGSGLILIGILIASRLRGFKIGPLPKAALKLGAISVAPAAAVSLVEPLLMWIPLGGIIGLVASFALYFALIGVFFELDESDTWLCVWTTFLIQVGIIVLIRIIV